MVALKTELEKLGAEVAITNDSLHLGKSDNISESVSIDTYNDHRMAMSFAIAGLIIPGVKIKNPKCVEKSFPDFFTHWPPSNAKKT